jgi:hypothetical protein
MVERKPNKRQVGSLAEIHDGDRGVCPSSEWTNGSGRYVTRRAVPPFCRLMRISEAMELPGEIGRQARRLHKARPRVQKVVAIVDLRGARMVLKRRDQGTRS